MSLSEKNLIEASLQEFKKQFQSSMPLRHFSEHQDEASVTEAAERIGDDVFWMHFMRKVKASKICRERRGDLVNMFSSELKKSIDESVNKNRDCKTESESFLQKKMDGICKDFQTSLEAKFLMNPDMQLKSVEEVIGEGRLSAMSYFDRMWKHGNVAAFEEYKIKLEQNLEDLKKDMLERQSRHLDIKAREDAMNSFNEVRKIVLVMSRRIKDELEEQEKRPKGIVKEGAQGIYNYVIGKGKILNEKLCLQLLGYLKDAIKSLDEAIEDISVNDATTWTDELVQKIKSSFLEYEELASGKHQQENGIAGPPSSHINGDKSNLKLTEASALTTACTPNKPIDLTAPQNVNVVEEGIDVENVKIPEKAATLKASQLPDSTEVSEIVNGNDVVEVGVKRCHVEDLEVATDVTKPAPKKLKEMTSDSSQQEAEFVNQSEVDFNVPDKDGLFPLLRALEEGQSVSWIKEMLTDGANVNIRTNNILKYNAAHHVIWSLINKKQTIEGALTNLDLLVAKGFKLLNEASSGGFTPLLLSMHYADLKEDLLNWFHENGADFNAVENKCENSVLLQGIYKQQSLEIIQKILCFGGNPTHVNKWKWNVLHMSARHAHESALKIFIDQIDVNERTINGNTPLHFLFSKDDLDYQECLKMLLEKKADLEARNNEGFVPLAFWIKYGKGNFFFVLMNLKDQLTITPEIASATLTVIVDEMGRLQKCLPPRTQDSSNEFVQFILLLIEEKRGALRLKDEAKWKLHKWDEIKNVALTPKLCKELRTSGGMKWKGQFNQIKGTVLGKLDFHTESGKIHTLSIETFLICLLHCKNFSGFVELCQSLQSFCVPVATRK